MGSFSYTRAGRTTKTKNFIPGDKCKLLIPKEFGGGSITMTYFDYGEIGVYDERGNEIVCYDLEEVRAFWNRNYVLPKHCNNGGRRVYELLHFPRNYSPNSPVQPTSEYTNHNRNIGIDMKYTDNDQEVHNEPFPIKLVSVRYKGTYEDCLDISWSDPDQGSCHTYRG